MLGLEGELRRVHIHRFDPVTFPIEEEARHAFMRLWREVELLESSYDIELAAERWLESVAKSLFFHMAVHIGTSGWSHDHWECPVSTIKESVRSSSLTKGAQSAFAPRSNLCNNALSRDNAYTRSRSSSERGRLTSYL
jgi:hypothetical protein